MKKGVIIIIIAVIVSAALIAVFSKSPQKPGESPTVAGEEQLANESKEVSVPDPAKMAPEQPIEDPMNQTETAPADDEMDQEMLNPMVVPGEEELKEFVAEDSEVDWQAARQYPRLDSSRLVEEHKEIAENAPVPVLLPESDELRNAGTMTLGNHWYAISMVDDEVTVAISGTSKAVRVPDAQMAEPPDIDHYIDSLIRNDGIVEVDFKAFGTYYNLTVECYDPQNDPRCAKDDYVLKLVDDLVMAGGKGL